MCSVKLLKTRTMNAIASPCLMDQTRIFYSFYAETMAAEAPVACDCDFTHTPDYTCHSRLLSGCALDEPDAGSLNALCTRRTWYITLLYEIDATDKLTRSTDFSYNSVSDDRAQILLINRSLQPFDTTYIEQ